MKRSCFGKCATFFYSAIRRGENDPRPASMRFLQGLFLGSNIVGLGIVCTTLVLGAHLQWQLDTAGKPTAQIVASILGIVAGSLPYALPYIARFIMTKWCQWRTGVSDYDISSHEQSVVARRLFRIKMFMYLLATLISILALVLWVKPPASKLHSGEMLSFGSQCGGFPQDSDTQMTGPDNSTSTVHHSNSVSELCNEAKASFLLLCVHIVFLAIGVLLETLIYFVPFKPVLKCSKGDW